MISFISLYGTSEHSIGWLAVLLDASVKSILLLALAAGLTLALKRSSAAFRHLIWLLAVVSCLFLPVISLTLPSWRLPIGPQAVPSAKAVSGFEGNLNATRLLSPDRQAATPHAPTPQVNPNHQTGGSPHPDQEASESIASQATGWRSLSTLWACIGIVWVIGMLVVLLPLVAGSVGIWRIVGRSQRITDGSLASLADELVKRRGVKRGFALVQSEMDMPLTWGVMRPLILIPVDAKHWSSDKQRAVLLHELAHVRRWDWLTQIIARMCCAMYWFNPLVWVADRRMRLERERACDDHVLTNGCWAADYASHLLEIARSSRPPVFAARAAVAMAQPSWIEKRLQVILATDRNRRRMKRVPITVSALTFACGVLLIGVMRPVKAIDEKELLLKIREGVFPSAEHTEKTLTYAEMEAIVNLPSNRIKYGLELSEQFFSMYPESKMRDEARMYQILFLLGLGNHGRADSEIDSYLVAFPKSKHAPELLSFKIDRFEKEGKYMEALAALDKITHSAILPRAYEEKAQLYSYMGDRVKAAEFRLRTAELMIGKPAPDFTLKDINGETVSLMAFRGKVVLIDFWTTTCGPCITKLPALRALHEKHHPDLALISISFDANDESVAKFVKNNEMPWIHIRDTMEMAAKFNIGYIPDYRVIDKKGLMRVRNLLGETGLNKVIPSLLAEAPRESDSANIAKLHELRGDLHEKRGEREQALAEYEHALRLQPNNRRLISAIGDWYEAATPKGDSQNEKALAFHDEALPKIVMANRSKTEADPGIGSTAFGFAKFYDEQGDAEKCWQAFQIAMENDPYGEFANRAKQMTDRFSTIRDVPAFKAFREAVRRQDAIGRKMVEFVNTGPREALKSYVPVEADGVVFTGVVLNSDGHLLVPDIVADAADIRVKISENQAAQVVARDSEASLAVLKVEGAKDLRPVEMGTVDDLKEYAPYDRTSADGRVGKLFPVIPLISARDDSGQSHGGQSFVIVGHKFDTLEIDNAGNITSFQIRALDQSPLSDAYVRYDCKLLGICVDDEAVNTGFYSGPGPKYNVLPIDQIGASLERMGMTDMLGN